MSEMVEVLIDSVRVSLMNPQRVVILRQKDAERYLPIWIGPYEAESITVALQETELSRPLTHDLLKNVFTVFEGKILRVEIVALREDIFYGNIVTEIGGRMANIDARPSDAIALALRVHVPILVSLDVMEEAGIVPEKDIQEQAAALQPRQESKPLPPAAKEGEDRLSVFEDFLSTLDDKKKNDGEAGAEPDEGGEAKPGKKPKK